MRNGSMVVDDKTGRMDIRFGINDYYGGLSCGTHLQVLIDGEWIPTRIEMEEGWCLVGIDTSVLEGLIVRI